MPEARLLIDLGNSRIKWLWSHGAELDLGSAGAGDLDAFASACRASAATRPDAVRVASVAAPERGRALLELCGSLWGLQPEVLVTQAEQCGVRNGYEHPAQLGIDRWLAIVGAANHHGKPVVVWDLGTASTLDAVSAGGQHLGGWILPGPVTMLDSLAEGTALPAVESLRQSASSEPGRCTTDAIRAGVLAAQIGALKRFLDSLSKAAGGAQRLVVTGGAAPMVTPFLDLEFVPDPWLVFRGMAMVQA